MTTILEERTFSNLQDESRAMFEDIEVKRCVFDRCVLSTTLDVSRRTVVRRVTSTGCEVRRVVIGGPILDEILVDGLKIQGLLQLWSPALRHGVLRGRIGRLMVSPYIEPLSATPAQQRAYEEANRSFY